MDVLSYDRERIRSALAQGPALDRGLLPHVVPLLARKSVADAVAQALSDVADRNVGQLSDYMLDPRTPLPVRCRLPAIIAAAGGTRAADALIRGLSDPRQEIRIACGRALDTLHQTQNVSVDRERIFEAIRRELAQTAEFRGSDVEHVFSLLGVVLPREPVRVAFEALDVKDPSLRGLALEYIESALPPDIRTALVERIQAVSPDEQPRRAEGQIREEFNALLNEIRRVIAERNGAPPAPSK
jgi:hypothetical protein